MLRFAQTGHSPAPAGARRPEKRPDETWLYGLNRPTDYSTIREKAQAGKSGSEKAGQTGIEKSDQILFGKNEWCCLNHAYLLLY